jgi:hypothetical protein
MSRTFTGALRASLDSRRERESDVFPAVYVGPTGAPGGHYVRRIGSTEDVVVAGPDKTFAPGTRLLVARNSGRGGWVILNEPPPGLGGASAFAVVRSDGEVDVVGIHEADPQTLEVGATETFTLTGYGFRDDPADTFRAVRDDGAGGWETDPLVTLGEPTVVSETEVEIDVTLSASAPTGHRISIDPTRS